MNKPSLNGRLFTLLSSLRLAVITMLTLGAVCAFATFYEMRNGTPAAQRDIYQTPWFAFLLGLLGANVLAVMISRYPWKKHHVGFVLAHVGILAILAGSVVSLYRGLDSNMPIYEGETSDRVLLLEKALVASVPGLSAQGVFPVAFEKRPPGPGRERRFRLGQSPVTLVADDYHAHVTLREGFEPGVGGSPALHLVVQAPMATQEAWLVPDDPERSHLDLGMVSFGLHVAATEAEQQRLLAASEGANHLSFVLGPAEALHFAASDATGARTTGRVEPGRPVASGWPGLGVTVDRFLPAASLVRSVVPETPPAKEEKRRAAVRLRLEGPSGASEPEWLLYGEQRAVRFGGGQAILGYRAPERPLEFKVTLLRFNNESYPGSRMAATYESTVRIDDPEQGSFETRISMNNPLHHRGYIFFQSSFVEGRPMMSIFSVARAPGLPLVYLGTTLVGVGIVWMFYVKPYLARRQAAQALAARRAQERSNEAKPSGLVPVVDAGGGDAAAGGA
jgi:hypothetical protein